MLYFNTIMYKCFNPRSLNSFPPNFFEQYAIHLQSEDLWTPALHKRFKSSFIEYVNTNKIEIMDEIIKRLQPITKDILTDEIFNDIILDINFIHNNIYDGIKIDSSKLIKLLTKHFSFSINDEIDYILTKIREIDENITEMNSLYTIYEDEPESLTKQYCIDLIKNIQSQIQGFYFKHFKEIPRIIINHITEYYNPFLDYITELLILNSRLDDNYLNLYTYESSPLYTINSSELIMKILAVNNYKSIFDELLSYFEALTDVVKINFNMIPKKLQNKKNSGNKRLGHTGRIFLRKTLLNAHNNLRVDGKFSGKLSHKNTIYKSYIDKLYSEVSPFPT